MLKTIFDAPLLFTQRAAPRSAILAGMAAACIAMALPANAATSLLDVTGAGDSSQTILAGQGAAVSFRFARAFNDVSISAGLLCIACNGTAWLLKDQIGAATQLTDIVATANYNLTTSASPLFTGLDLAAGDYYLLLTIGGSTGGAGWLASGTPSITLAPDVFYNGGLFAEDLDALAYRSTFLVQFGGPAMHFRIDTAATIDPPPGGGGGGAVPEPASWAMLVMGFGFVGAGLRRRTRVTAIAA